MPVHSAALLLYRRANGSAEVFLGHMGGPFWARKDAGARSIPKGEFAEEVGVVWEGPVTRLGEFRQPSGKVLVVHVAPAEAPLEFVGSNEFTVEWPRGSGRMQSFPEIDRAGWFDLAQAREKVVRGQVPVLDALARLVL